MSDETCIEWREWGADAFAEAGERDRPVLLSLTATWCADCHEMDAGTYADPRVAARVADEVVPVRVDVDRHPRVRERYNMGGFPSTVFTTPAGEVLTGAGYLGPEGMRQALEAAGSMWAERGADAGRVPRALAGDPTPAGEVDDRIERLLLSRVREAYDREFAGWGTGAKFPLPRTVEFALKRDREIALRTLDAVGRNLLDDVAGGFFRYAGRRDWSAVGHEKRLDDNAALVRAFADAYRYTGREAYRDPAALTVGFLTDDLWTGAAFAGSTGPAAGSDYYDRDAAGRAEATGPRTDLTAYAGPNGLAVDALLAYHAVTDDDRAREFAVRALDHLEATLVDGSGAVTRFREGGESGTAGETGLLTDQARVAAGFVRAAQVLGGGYLDVARAVADHAVATLHDAPAFRDGPAEGPGLLDRPLRPLDGNVEMADALLDLAALVEARSGGDEAGDDPAVSGSEREVDPDEPGGDPDDVAARYRAVAREAVGAFAGARDRFGPRVAGYGAVAARLCRPGLVVAVGTGAGSDLHRAALRVADHEAVVVPEAAVPRETAEVRRGDAVATAATPEELAARVSEVSAAAEGDASTVDAGGNAADGASDAGDGSGGDA